MIVCDKCGGPVEFILNVDYLNNTNFSRIDLCDKHYSEIINLIHSENEPQKTELKNLDSKNNQENKGGDESIFNEKEKTDIENKSIDQTFSPKRRKRGRPPKNTNPSI